jgi:hypothetical protein
MEKKKSYKPGESVPVTILVGAVLGLVIGLLMRGC